MDKWSRVPLANLTEPDTPVTYGVVKPGPEDPDNGVLFIRGGDIAEGRVLTEQLRTITRGVSEQYRRTQLRGGEIVVSLVGNPGQVAIVPASLRGANIARQAGLVRLRKDIDARFVKYFLSSRVGQDSLGAHSLGSVQQVINLRDLKTVEIPLPPPSEQRAIAHILSTLDDKIELNRRMNETLEEMARALFKAWFVDFEPVRAKAEGRDPGLPKPIAHLFPDSFKDSELGEIPKGWEVGPLGRFFEVGLGGAWGEDLESDRATSRVLCLRGIDCHDLAEGRVPDVPVRWVSSKQASDRQLSDGTILIEGSGSFCGRSMIWKRAYGQLLGEPICYSNFCKRLDPICSATQAVVCWMQMREAYRDGVLQSFRTGTAFPNFDVHGMLEGLEVVVPPDSLADVYAQFFKFSQRVDLMTQSRTLVALRDTLLPKLISGELRVKDAEKRVAAVV